MLRAANPFPAVARTVAPTAGFESLSSTFPAMQVTSLTEICAVKQDPPPAHDAGSAGPVTVITGCEVRLASQGSSTEIATVPPGAKSMQAGSPAVPVRPRTVPV